MEGQSRAVLLLVRDHVGAVPAARAYPRDNLNLHPCLADLRVLPVHG